MEHMQSQEQEAHGNEKHQRLRVFVPDFHASLAQPRLKIVYADQTFNLAAVYAVGLYVDPHAAKKLLTGKVTAGTSAPDQAVYDGGLYYLPLYLCSIPRMGG